jgi:SGNH hydrolase-like domain, acetyltransferase AlgX
MAGESGRPGGALRAEGRPPLFDDPSNAGYLASDDPEKYQGTRPAVQAVIAVSRWLKRQNIDLILAPAPKMAEVYNDRLGLPVPPGRIAAPHHRRLLLDILNADVEVVDLLPAFLTERDSDPQPLYIPDDSHWSDRAQLIAAREIGKRLKRYAFVKTALGGKPLFAVSPMEMPFHGSALGLMNNSQKAEVRDFSAHMKLTRITKLDGVPFEEPQQSPVVVIGDSYTHYFQLAILKGTGIDALLSKEINIPISNVSSAGATTGPIKDFLRNPFLLRDRKVVVWIVTNTILSYDSLWDLPQLPEQVAAPTTKP